MNRFVCNFTLTLLSHFLYGVLCRLQGQTLWDLVKQHLISAHFRLRSMRREAKCLRTSGNKRAAALTFPFILPQGLQYGLHRELSFSSWKPFRNSLHSFSVSLHLRSPVPDPGCWLRIRAARARFRSPATVSGARPLVSECPAPAHLRIRLSRRAVMNIATRLNFGPRCLATSTAGSRHA